MKIKRLINFLVMSVLLLVSSDTVKASQSKKSRLMEMVVSKTGFLCKIYRDYTSLITHVEIAKEDQDVYSFNLKSPYPLSFKDICSHCPWAFQEQFLNIVMTHYSINRSSKVVVENSYEKNRIAPSGVPFIDEFDVSDFMVSDEEFARIAQKKLVDYSSLPEEEKIWLVALPEEVNFVDESFAFLSDFEK